MLHMLDTNIFSALMKGHADVRMRLQSLDAADVCISAITRSEVQFGVARRPEATKLAETAATALQFFRTEPWDSLAADRHGTLRALLRDGGTPIGDFDEMIAAHALVLNAVLVTDNVKHFSRVPTLKVENWVRDH